MQPMAELIRSYDVSTNNPAEIVKLARSLHRVGIKRRRTGIQFWVEHGERNCRDARDMVSFAREVQH